MAFLLSHPLTLSSEVTISGESQNFWMGPPVFLGSSDMIVAAVRMVNSESLVIFSSSAFVATNNQPKLVAVVTRWDVKFLQKDTKFQES